MSKEPVPTWSHHAWLLDEYARLKRAICRSELLKAAVAVEEAAELDVCSIGLIARVAASLRREASELGCEP